MTAKDDALEVVLRVHLVGTIVLPRLRSVTEKIHNSMLLADNLQIIVDNLAVLD